MDKTSFKIFITILTSSLILILVVMILSVKFKGKEEIKVKYVDNPTMFLTVESCVNKYIGLINSENVDAVYNLIDEDYKKENEITIYNVLANNVKLSNNSYSFIAEKMLEDEVIKYKYYVRGKLYEEEYGNELFEGEVIDYEIIVILNMENNTYTVIPSEVGDYFEAI